MTEQQNHYYQLSPQVLYSHALAAGEGSLTDQGVLSVDTGQFTGRSPRDRFIVKDARSADLVWWGEVNIPFEPAAFERLHVQMLRYLENKRCYISDHWAGADPGSRISLRVMCEKAYQSLFAHNLFIQPDGRLPAEPEWTVIAAPGFAADPATDGTRQGNFTIINLSSRLILVGGTGYTGEIKKAVFTVLNCLLPQQGILPMHCSANLGAGGDTAIFFGLSGTGKTTLSADPGRRLIGDDEHGWSAEHIFNFEGGCYAKTAQLSAAKEPQIYGAIRPGALLENVSLVPGSLRVDYEDTSKTENSRVSYPLRYIPNAVLPAISGPPKHIFFLSCDAFGVLPPVARLDREQALYYFLSGYTAKVAGTEHGVDEPQATFSACFGKAFLPLHPRTYAGLLEQRLNAEQPQVWLINTGWTGGAYGSGQRISLAYTRAIIKAALEGALDHADYETLPIFDLQIPKRCAGVPENVLNPVRSWADEDAYWQQARALKDLFVNNFATFAA